MASRLSCRTAVGFLVLVAAACSGGAAPPAAAPATTSGSAAPPTATARPAPLRMTVSWSQPGGGQAGVWMPYEGGMFAEHGLDVELLHVSNTSRIIQAMVAGEIHMAPVDPVASIQ